MARKVVRFLDRLVDLATLIICLLFFLIGLYALLDSYLVYQSAGDDSLLKYKPGYGSDDTEWEPIEGMVAWLTIDGTGVDYPVMQGEDNWEYLNKDPYGKYSLSGSIFLDTRNSPDFSDPYLLIYGHHMDHGMMFGALDQYFDEEFFNSHRTGTLVAGDDVYSLEIFALLEAQASNASIFAPTEADDETLPYIHEYAMYKDMGMYPETGDKLVGFSTCKYPDTAERTIVFARARLQQPDSIAEGMEGAEAGWPVWDYTSPAEGLPVPLVTQDKNMQAAQQEEQDAGYSATDSGDDTAREGWNQYEGLTEWDPVPGVSGY